jgi:hypothetical protein
MIRDIIERFRYRFQLWRRQVRDDYIGPPGTRTPSVRERYGLPGPTTNWEDPKFKVMLTESTPNFIVREVGVYFLMIALLTSIGSILDRLLSGGQSIVSVVFLVLVALWTLLSISFTVDVIKRRRAYRSSDPDI